MANDGNFLNLASGQRVLDRGIQTSAGAGDANKLIRLDAAGKIDMTFMPTGVGNEARTILASETLTAGNLVNVYNNAGTINVRKADATTSGKEANGFILAGITSGASGTVYLEEGLNNAVSSLTVGAVYYLATTAGGLTTTAPSASGNVVQEVGKALSATELLFRPRSTVTIT